MFELNVQSITDSCQSPGARRVIEALSRVGAVGCLILGHNRLGDEGCVELLKYLRSEEGERHKVAGIMLNANGLGDVALDSLGSFLRGNEWLKELYLASVSLNILTGSSIADSTPAERFRRRFRYRWLLCGRAQLFVTEVPITVQLWWAF